MSTHEYIGGSIKSKIRKQIKNYKQPIIHRKDETNFIRYFIILTIFMLFGAVAGWPYGYYVLLRWVACISSILVAFQAFEKNIDWAKVVFIVIAILFNPLAPIYLSRSTWIPLDIVTAILFILGKNNRGRIIGTPIFFNTPSAINSCPYYLTIFLKKKDIISLLSY